MANTQQNVLFGKDFVDVQFGKVYMTINDRRYHLFNVKSIKADLEKDNQEYNTLDNTTTQHMAVKQKGTFEAEAYGPLNLTNEIAKELKKNHKKYRFTIQATMDDENPGLGSQTVFLKYCMTNSDNLFDLNADGGAYIQDISGTFDDWEIREEFGLVEGMQIR